MSYVECPDCGKKTEVFGPSKLDAVAEQYGLPVLGRLPINPALAAACDAGAIETDLPEGMLPDALAKVAAVPEHAESPAADDASA